MILVLVVAAAGIIGTACWWMWLVRRQPGPTSTHRDPDWGDWPRDQRAL